MLRRPSLTQRVKALGLLQPARGRPRLPARGVTLLRLCHAGRLKGGLSISLRALPDEVVGALTHAMGGPAMRLRVLDVRGTRPVMLEVKAGELVEKWEVDGVEGLAHNLNDLYRDDATVRAVAVLGEWEDMLALWCVPKAVLPRLLDARLLDDARNLRTLHGLADADPRA